MQPSRPDRCSSSRARPGANSQRRAGGGGRAPSAEDAGFPPDPAAEAALGAGRPRAAARLQLARMLRDDACSPAPLLQSALQRVDSRRVLLAPVIARRRAEPSLVCCDVRVRWHALARLAHSGVGVGRAKGAGGTEGAVEAADAVVRHSAAGVHLHVPPPEEAAHQPAVPGPPEKIYIKN